MEYYVIIRNICDEYKNIWKVFVLLSSKRGNIFWFLLKKKEIIYIE